MGDGCGLVEATNHAVRLLRLPHGDDGVTMLCLRARPASRRFFYQALLSKPFLLIRNEEFSACVDAFDDVLERMEKDFNFKYAPRQPACAPWVVCS